MKNFLTVLKFELDNYFKSKSYVISTILICVLAAGIMFIPRFFQDSKKGDEVSKEEEAEETAESGFLIYDPQQILDTSYLTEFFDEEFTVCQSKEEIEENIKNEKAEAGFVINSLTDFDYYVLNKSIMDENAAMFSEYMQMMVKLDYCQRNNLDLDEFLEVEYMDININEQVLGKDSSENYWYCYILVIIIFGLIVMYGTTIASSVTNEKSNRSIEILVTSTDSVSLLFGKVFAGVIATIFQVGLIGGSLLGSYQANKQFWSVDIASFLDIPANVLVIFAVFGIGGFLFYAFMYGALGALVSKIEDLNKSTGTAQMLVMLVYIVVLVQLFNPDGIIMKVCSYLPFSSYSAMFARVAMGSVATWEVVLSAVILYASVILMGILGGKIFRTSTLRYGNPIKLSTALKALKKNKD